MTTAIIIARGGSRRLPRKNVRPFCGHPLIAWTITQARAADSVDRVIMCTDDDEIERVSVDYGAEVIRHPEWPENALRTFRWAIDKGNVCSSEMDEIVSMLPTSPMRRPGDIDACIAKRRQFGTPFMSPSIVHREVVLCKIIGEHECRRSMMDKGSQYVAPAMGYGVFNARYYTETYLQLWDDDVSIEEFDRKILDDEVPGEGWWYEVPGWMQFEVDTLAEFEFCEVLMEHYIIKGKRMEEVYG